MKLSAAQLVTAAALIALSAAADAAPVQPRFNRDVRPILAEHCFACHGFDEAARKAGLRLDLREEALRSRDGVTPIVPGDPKESEVWLRITNSDPGEVMPPPEAHRELDAAKIETLQTWIEQGAAYEGHWAFTPPVRLDPPVVTGNPSLAPIDAFVQARLAQEDLKPAPEANRHTLIRRLSFDLAGLPPSAEETEAFVRNTGPGAYEDLVERLLKSPHFGERMALDWLDAARYADTNGFSIDGGRHSWLWRDWVIQAFNDNKPYDRFLIEQLAGDLLPLPGRTDAELIATGFQRNNMVTHEGGTIPEENLTNYNVDRVKTLGEAVLGLTLACAQCHDHKFDPITQRDFYQLYAFFNTMDDRGLDGDGGVNPAPSISARTVLQTGEEPELRKRIAEIRAVLARRDNAILTAWEDRQRTLLAGRGRGFRLLPIKALKVSTPNRGAGFDIEGENRVRIRQGGGLAAFDVSAELPSTPEPITGLRVVVHPLSELPGGGWGHGRFSGKRRDSAADERGTFVLTAISATADTVPGDQINLHKLLDIERVTASSWDAKFPPAGCLDPRNTSGWSPAPSSEGPVHLTATWQTPIRSDVTPYLTTQLNFGSGNNLVAGLVELFAVTGTDDGTDLPPEIVAAIEMPAALRDEPAWAALWKHCSAHAEELEPLRVELANLEDRLNALTESFPAMVMNVAATPRETRILRRGDYAQPTEPVSAGTPAALPPMPDGAPADRLGLARWLTMPGHPLTARVAVNRIWKSLFGRGLVATAADFGAQGEWPSHPELLDWLAVEFQESGWDVKHLVRLIVSSATYRQSSAACPDLIEKDPENRLLARGPRFRLPAEFVRDQALQASGLLVQRIGGPSVNPYAPGDLWREISHYGSTPATAQTFVQDHGEKLYRRSIYTYWKRTMPPPNLAVFDAPSREVCTVGRANTTTPLQALVTLNDVQFVEAARAFAERMLSRRGSDVSRLEWAFLECLSRPPNQEELDITAAALDRERKRYGRDERAAVEFLSIGESPRDLSLPPSEHAAWSQVATLLLNLSETVTRN